MSEVCGSGCCCCCFCPCCLLASAAVLMRSAAASLSRSEKELVFSSFLFSGREDPPNRFPPPLAKLLFPPELPPEARLPFGGVRVVSSVSTVPVDGTMPPPFVTLCLLRSDMDE